MVAEMNLGNDLNSFRPGLTVLEGNGSLIRRHLAYPFKVPEEVEMPPAATKLSVRHGMQA